MTRIATATGKTGTRAAICRCSRRSWSRPTGTSTRCTWTSATYPIDRTRVTITGPSMGGIGTAACALHHPDRFAAAEPLCGYHSYFVRSDIGARAMRPWERFVAEERSNVFWAENGMYLPLYIVHGTKDLPEENSGVLIDRYTELNYDVTHEHPELGHN